VRRGVEQTQKADAAPVARAQHEQVAGAVEERELPPVQAQGGGDILKIVRPGVRPAFPADAGGQGVQGGGQCLRVESLAQRAPRLGLVAGGLGVVGGEGDELGLALVIGVHGDAAAGEDARGLVGQYLHQEGRVG